MEETPYLAHREHLIERYGYLPLLGSSNPDYLRRLLSIARLRKFQAGEVIAIEGEYDHWAYILLDGEVSILKGDRELARLETPGDTFGEQVLIDLRPRSATMEAVSETLCLAIDGALVGRMPRPERDAFNAIFFQLLAEALSARLRDANETLIRLQEALEDCQGEA